MSKAMKNGGTQDVRAFMKGHGWLSCTPSPFADALLDRCKLRTATRGETVYLAGTACDGIRGVVSGGFAFQIAPHEQGPHLAHAFRPGSWFGETEVFDRKPKIGTFQATRDSTFLHLPLTEIHRLAALEPETWRWVGLLGAQHLELALGVIDDQMLRDAGDRIAALLLRLGGVRSADAPGDPQPEIDVTQNDLAQLATVSRATVVDKLQALERRGLIARTYGGIQLLDPAALRDWLSVQIS